MLLTGCVSTTTQGGATEDALCTVWGESLPTRSQSDTAQTQEEIQNGYAVFSLACPQHLELIP